MTERTGNLHLKPAADRRVRHPDGRLFARDGERVPAAPHYLRLRQAGDLVPAPALPAHPKRTRSTTSRKKTGEGSKTA